MKKLKDSPEVRKLHRQAIKWHNEKFDKLTGIKKVNGKLKLFTPEADITYKMKKIVSAIKKAVVHLNILGLLFIVACGEDNNPTGNNNPPVNNNAVLTIDTFKVEHSSIIFRDTVLTSSLMSKSVKIDFSTETNCTINDVPQLTIKYNNVITLNSIDTLNKPLSFTQTRDSSKSTSLELSLFMSANGMRYLKFTNVKVYILN